MRGGWKLYLLPWKALLEGGKGLKMRWKGKLKFSITFLSKQENKMLVMNKINLSQFHSDYCLSRNPKFPLQNLVLISQLGYSFVTGIMREL